MISLLKNLPLFSYYDQKIKKDACTHKIMKQSVIYVALLVRNYDEAIKFYTEKLHFELVENIDQPEQNKRWVAISPLGSNGTCLLLSKARDEDLEIRVGRQTGDKVGFFLNTDDFWRDYKEMVANGIKFVREPKEQPYGLVAVFEDLYGNKWDLLQMNENHPMAKRA